jgi:hypothetical protein
MKLGLSRLSCSVIFGWLFDYGLPFDIEHKFDGKKEIIK